MTPGEELVSRQWSPEESLVESNLIEMASNLLAMSSRSLHASPAAASYLKSETLSVENVKPKETQDTSGYLVPVLSKPFLHVFYIVFGHAKGPTSFVSTQKLLVTRSC